MECPTLSLDDIRGYWVGQYRVPTEIEKPGCFSLGKTRIFEPAADMYIFII